VTPSIDNAPNIAQAQQRQASQEDSDISDGSGRLFSMYLDRAIAEDKEMVESWKGDAEGMLVFVSLPTTSASACN
jgi:hypothetical protein